MPPIAFRLKEEQGGKAGRPMMVEEAEFPLEEIKHYCQIATALKKTMEVQEEIGNLYLDIEKGIVSINDKVGRRI